MFRTTIRKRFVFSFLTPVIFIVMVCVNYYSNIAELWEKIDKRTEGTVLEAISDGNTTEGRHVRMLKDVQNIVRSTPSMDEGTMRKAISDRTLVERRSIDFNVNSAGIVIMQRPSFVSKPKPMYTFMNVSALNASGVYPHPLPEYMYYMKQRTPVNSWIFPTIQHNSSLCGLNGGDDVILLALVCTSPRNRRQRNDIRATWGGVMKSMSGVRLNFVIGKAAHRSKMTALLVEAEIYRDMIIFDFLDDYENLTIKSMMSLTWANKYCPNVDFVLKADDDMLLNVHAVMSSLLEHRKDPSHHIIGRNAGHSLVNRTNKWHIPFTQYPFHRFPSYTEGPAYVLTSYAVSRIVATSPYVPIVRLEDVYVNGIVRRVAGLNVTHDNAWRMVPAFKRLVRGEFVGVHHVGILRRREIHRRIETHNRNLSNVEIEMVS